MEHDDVVGMVARLDQYIAGLKALIAESPLDADDFRKRAVIELLSLLETRAEAASLLDTQTEAEGKLRAE